MSQTDKYEYEALDGYGEDYIRYLVLDPGKDDEPLSGRLVIDHIDNIPWFDAISYVWGSHERVGEIICDGKAIGLTASLSEVLRRVRLSDETRNVWADQVCINQDDKVERGHQVALMSRIYRWSRTTLAYAGDASDDAVNAVSSLLEEVNKMIELSKMQYESLRDMPLMNSRDALFHDPRWASMAALMDSELWDRVWIVQELGLSQRAQILYGNTFLDWQSIIPISQWLRFVGRTIIDKHRIHCPTVHTERKSIWRTTSAEGHADLNKETADLSLLNILNHSRTLKASDPRDHVYAFLGHQSAKHPDTGQLMVSPDYTISTESMLLEFAARWLEWTKDLNILSYVDHDSGGPPPINAFPSWVPRWDRRTAKIYTFAHQDIWYAGGELTEATTLAEDGRSLMVRGARIDEISFRSEAFANADFLISDEGDANGAAFYEVYRKLGEVMKHALDQSSPCIYGAQNRFAAIARTLIAAQYYTTDSMQFESDAAAFLLPIVSGYLSHLDISEIPTERVGDSSGAARYKFRVRRGLAGRRFAISRQGLFGLVPAAAREGDICFVVFGMSAPLILRSVPDTEGYYQLIGQAYLLGMMDGEAMERLGSDEYHEEDIVLI
jgi:hypothetical protein